MWALVAYLNVAVLLDRWVGFDKGEEEEVRAVLEGGDGVWSGDEFMSVYSLNCALWVTSIQRTPATSPACLKFTQGALILSNMTFLTCTVGRFIPGCYMTFECDAHWTAVSLFRPDDKY